MADLTPIQAALRGAQASRPARTPLGRGMDRGPAVVLVDGEHYPTAVADTVAQLIMDGWDIRCAALLGGTEKLRGTPDYGVPVVQGDGAIAVLGAALSAHPDARWVLDLADEPVLVAERRMELIAVAAGTGRSYLGPDLTVIPPQFVPVNVPTIEIVGTGKRIGKTAVSGHVARLADLHRGGRGSVIVLAMGRGGPAEPVVVDRAEGPVTVQQLLELSRQGLHAASDYLEGAALTGLTTIGCRRVGGGLLGVPVGGNVVEGAQLAARLEPELLIVEGSGSCTPPVAADRTLLIATTARPGDLVEGAGLFRLGRADLVLITSNDSAAASDMRKRAEGRAHELGCAPQVIPIQLRPTPTGEVAGARLAVFTTAPTEIGPLVEQSMVDYGADVAVVSHHLADRERLITDLDAARQAGAEVLAVEIKAAAIDGVAEYAATHDIPLVLLDNRPYSLDGDIDLDAVLVAFAS